MDIHDLARGRILVLRFSGLLLFALVLLAGRLGYLHLSLNEQARAEVLAATLRTRVVPAQRGQIFDRHGRALASNEQALRVDVWPPKLTGVTRTPGERVKHARRIADLLAPAVSASPDALIQNLMGDKNRTLGLPVSDPDTQQWIRAGLGDEFKGLDVHEVSVRRYPWGSTAGNLIGFLDSAGKGASGLERGLEVWLEGSDGERNVRVDHRGLEQVDPRLPVQAPFHGLDVTLTLDVKVQQLVEQELLELMNSQEAERAVGVVLDARNGDLLALASVPRLDPDRRGSITTAGMRLGSVQDQYNPGSSFKPLMMAAALDLGLAHTSDPPIDCSKFEYWSKVRDSHPQDHALDLAEILVHSSNIGMATIMTRITPEDRPRDAAAMAPLYQYLVNLGLGTDTGLPLFGEAQGHFDPLEKWHRRYHVAQIARGQAITLSTVQFAAAINALTDGQYRPPRLVASVSNGVDGEFEEFPHALPTPVFHPDTAETVRGWMQRVVEEGACQEMKSLGLAVAGKTGTARLEDDLESGDEMHSYVAMVPANDPVVTLVLSVRRPRNARYASQSAAPAMGRLIRSLAPYLGLTLKGTRG
ncbi:MAG: cell division protein FtsI [Planctomycetota bacterium]|nr:MAG: cell division protein FtsI [Planctomycetota bacterium]